MYGSDGRAARIGYRIAFQVGLLVGLLGCDDPTRPLEAPSHLDQSLMLFGILDPDSASQPIMVGTSANAGTGGASRTDPLEGVFAEVFAGDTRLLRVEPDTTFPPDPLDPCFDRYGRRIWQLCLHLDFRPVAGRTYTIRVSAKDRATVTATVHVPGGFDIVDVSAAGHPPGTERLSARWTRSEAVHRYFVALRASDNDCELNGYGCPGGWYAVTTDTMIETVVPRRELRHGSGTWFVDIYALDRALHEYLTTGTGGEFFSVPPTSNVEGGYGVVGSWLRRSYEAGS